VDFKNKYDLMPFPGFIVTVSPKKKNNKTGNLLLMNPEATRTPGRAHTSVRMNGLCFVSH